ncbi:LuxR C-terminal-related transcriptional regulator [Arthrobacter sp. 92]|uniref:LuxR family transcriptional regulator n=1 Tax=Arthrobacter sp. 92 TaxID=3418175 RepID=UPI003CFC1B85
MELRAGSASFPPVIRAAELKAVVRALAGSESSGVIVTGPAGSGRSTLLDAAADVLSRQFAVGTYSIPESCARTKLGIGAILAPDLPAGAKVSPLTIVRACRDALRNRDPGATGIVVVLDNVDHLDGLSLWVLSQLLAEPDIKILASHRSDRQLQMSLMEAVVARQLSVVSLEALTPERMRHYLQLLLPARPNRALIKAVHAQSGGSPLMALWLTEKALADGDIVVQSGTCVLMRALASHGRQEEDLARLRLGALTPEERRVVDCLAAGEPAPLAALTHMAPPETLTALEQRDIIQIRRDGHAAVCLRHPLEGEVARQELSGARARELRGRLFSQPAPLRDDSLWDFLRRVDSDLDNGTMVPDLDLMAVATTANNLYDSHRALRAAEAVRAPELHLLAQTEMARAWFHLRKYGKSVALLRTLVDTTPAVLSIEFARAVALLIQALVPTNPGRDALQAVLDRARQRLSMAAAASGGDSAADNYQHAVEDELDVLQLYLESRDGTWPSPSGELFHRLCPDRAAAGADSEASTDIGPDPVPGSHAGILLLALASQGLSARGQLADAVALSSRALGAVECLPRCNVDFHSTVLTIHASNLTRLGQSPETGSAAADCAGSTRWMSYPGGPMQLFRAMMLCRHTGAGHPGQPCQEPWQGDAGDPDDLLTLTLGTQATAAWLTWDLDQLRSSPAPRGGHPAGGGFIAGPTGEYATVPAVSAPDAATPARYFTAATSANAVGSRQRGVRNPVTAGGNRGRRAMELLNLGVAPRAETPRPGEGPPDWNWGSVAGRGALPVDSLDWLPVGSRRQPVGGMAGVQPGSGEGRGTGADTAKLSAREREVAVLVVSGLGSADVAARLGIAVNTVNAHLQRIYGKLGVSRRRELAELWRNQNAGQQ